jgi:hypothetical protein
MGLYWTIFGLLLLSVLFEFQPSVILKRQIIALWCVFFVFWGGLRWEIGGDWDQYFEHFQNSTWSNIFDYDRYGNGNERLEPAFVFFNVFIKTIGGYFWVYNIVILCIIEFGTYKFCNSVSSRHPLIPFILVSMGATASIFPVRAGLSLGLCYIAYQYIIKKDLKKFLFWVLIATLLHNQCIVLFPLYFLGYIKFKEYHLIIAYILFAGIGLVMQKYFVLLMMFFSGSIADKALLYTEVETEGYSGPSYIGWVLNFMFLIVYLYVGKKAKIRYTQSYNTLINGFMIYMLIFFVFSDGMGDLGRLSGLYLPCQLALFSYAYSFFYDIKNDSNQNRRSANALILLKKKNNMFRFKKNDLIRIFLCMFVLSYFTYKYLGSFHGYYFEDACVPYKSIFESPDAFK